MDVLGIVLLICLLVAIIGRLLHGQNLGYGPQVATKEPEATTRVDSGSEDRVTPVVQDPAPAECPPARTSRIPRGATTQVEIVPSSFTSETKSYQAAVKSLVEDSTRNALVLEKVKELLDIGNVWVYATNSRQFSILLGIFNEAGLSTVDTRSDGYKIPRSGRHVVVFQNMAGFSGGSVLMAGPCNESTFLSIMIDAESNPKRKLKKLVDFQDNASVFTKAFETRLDHVRAHFGLTDI